MTIPVTSKGQPRTVAKREIGDRESIGSCSQLEDDKACTVENRHTRRIKVQAEAGAAATKRAAALSAALLEDDDQAASASRTGRKSLFASRNDTTGGLHAGGFEAGFGDENENASGDGRDDEEPVNIVVVSRCRPLLVREMKRGVRAAVFCDGNDIIVSGELLPNKRPRRFGFDRVFGKQAFRDVKPMKESPLSSHSCS